ncbi:phenylalanine--tRNA ligase subunit alpha [Patescibacteria group bacterium]
MQNKLNKIKQKVLTEIKNIKELSVLRDLEIKYLGRKGELTKVLRGLSDLSLDQKKVLGRLANEIKNEIEKIFVKANNVLNKKESDIFLKKEWIDTTQPSLKAKEIGHLHPLTQVQNEIEDIFISMGFMVLDGPELESEYYNFDALNSPDWHPSRDMQDTFYVENAPLLPEEACPPYWRGVGLPAVLAGGGGSKPVKSVVGAGPCACPKVQNRLLMRTQTSPVQIRAMQKYGAPIKAIAPGRCFRNEATDACHEHTFDQVEGLMIDKDISIANLIATIKTLLKGVFKKDVKVRLRPGYFPFVEPGFELDINCQICGGKGCPSCKNSGWLELLPCGMVHPNVLKYGGVDTDKYSGFAFGLGITRLVMMKYGIDDMRMLLSGDLRFLKQF